MGRRTSTWRARGWVLAAAAVLLWRAAALARPSSMISIPDALRLPTALLGLVFLACGFWAWWARPNRWTLLLLLYGLGQGMHWGGSIGAPSLGLELSLLLLYLAATALGEAAFLHLALIYPSGGVAPAWRAALYSPAALALLLATTAAHLPRPSLETVIGLLLLVANLIGIAGGVAFLVRLVRADAETRRAARLALIVGGTIAGTALALLGSSGALPGPAEAWNLAHGIIPICLAVALLSRPAEP